MPKFKVQKHVIIVGIAWAAILTIQFVFPIGGQSTTTIAAVQGSISPEELTRVAGPMPTTRVANWL